MNGMEPEKGERWRRWTVGCLTVAAGTLPFSHVPTQMALVLAVVGWIGWSIRSGRIRIEKDPFLWAASVYWGWNLIASALSVRPGHSLGALIDNEWPALLGLLIWWSFKSTRELELLLRSTFVASGIAFLYGIIQTFTGVEWIKGIQLYQAVPGYARAVGFTGYPLTFAGFAMTILFLSGAYALQRPRAGARWLVPVLAMGAILASFARSIWVATGGLTALTSVLMLKGRLRLLAIGAGVAAVAVVLSLQPLRTRAVETLDFSSASTSTRFTVWKTALSMAGDHLLFGIGQDNFTYHFEEYRVPGYVETFVHPHNDYISVLVHGGAIALGAFVWMWVVVLKRGLAAWRERGDSLERWIGLGGTLGMAGFLASAMFQNYYGTFVNCFNWWTVTGCILLCYKLLSEQRNRSGGSGPAASGG